MQKFVVLLKYLNKNALTPEGLTELASAFGGSLTLDEAAVLSKAFQTRGALGLLEHVSLVQKALPQPQKAQDIVNTVVTCPHCGTVFRS